MKTLRRLVEISLGLFSTRSTLLWKSQGGGEKIRSISQSPLVKIFRIFYHGFFDSYYGW